MSWVRVPGNWGGDGSHRCRKWVEWEPPDLSTSSHLEPTKSTLFGGGVFVDVIKLKI